MKTAEMSNPIRRLRHKGRGLTIHVQSRFIRHPRVQGTVLEVNLSQGGVNSIANGRVALVTLASAMVTTPPESEPVGLANDLHPRRENTYLRLLGGLLLCSVRGFDSNHPYAAARATIHWLNSQNATVKVSEQTLADIVKCIQRLPLDPSS